MSSCHMDNPPNWTQPRRFADFYRSYESIAAHFAGQRASDEDPQFVWEHDLPLLDGALAHVGCRVVDVHPAGDHVLWIGEVEHLYHREGEPLLFYTGRFGTLRETSDRETAARRAGGSA